MEPDSTAPDWDTLREGDVVHLEDFDTGSVQFRVGADAIYPQEFPTVHWDHPYLSLAAAQRQVEEGLLRKKYDAASNTWRY
jgi:hypothetical protein